jgi:Putative adhesin
MTTPLRLTPGRVLALILGVPIVLAFIAWIGLTEVAYAGQDTYPVRLAVPVRGGTASLSAGSADVRVTQGAGRRLRLTGTARYSIVRSTVTLRTTSSGVTVMPQCHFVIAVCSFDFAAVLPEGKHAQVSAGSGDLTLTGLTGPVTAGSGSGDVRADLLSGAVSLQSGSGDISGDALSGPQVTLKDDSGDIVIAGLAGGHVVASASSGDIALTFTKVPALVQVSDSSGDVTLVLPPGGTRYRVHASTVSGDRAVSVPTSSASRHVITVTSSSGDISIIN